jgi:DNA-binding CsgD family transcriptional regulator
MNETEIRWRWVLACASRLGTAVWIRGPRGRLRYVNPDAETLLGKPAREVLGAPCYRVFAAQDANGEPFCGPSCPLLQMTRRGTRIAPMDLRLDGTAHPAHWIRVVALPFSGKNSKDPYLVHCAWSIDGEHRIREFTRRLASRSGALPPPTVARSCIGGEPLPITPPRGAELTPREREILELLAEDRNLYDVATTLHVSYVTVRNHVQHILSKLGVHSILEASAVYVMMTSDSDATTLSPMG